MTALPQHTVTEADCRRARRIGLAMWEHNAPRPALDDLGSWLAVATPGGAMFQSLDERLSRIASHFPGGVLPQYLQEA